MFKLAKYLKPFIGLIIAAIVLLFVQATADLSLPDYMSKIVNVGIQQHGIENAVPEAVRQNQMDKLTLFMKESEKNKVLDHYTLIDKTNSDYDRYVRDYPTLAKEPVFVLKGTNPSTIKQLNPIMGKAFLVVSGIEKMKSEAKGGQLNFNGQKIPANTDLFALFKQMPSEQRIKIANQSNKKFTALGENMIVQAASGAIKQEYFALGMDTGKIQSDYILHVGMIMLLISLVSAVAIIIVGFLSSKAAAGLA
ncbi:MAG: ABC transporter ATP-binding protein, partial [Bacillota bacterium]|nr:ABC transporter ATP-binding protein [Bacillota bacterium]